MKILSENYGNFFMGWKLIKIIKILREILKKCYKNK